MVTQKYAAGNLTATSGTVKFRDGIPGFADERIGERGTFGGGYGVERMESKLGYGIGMFGGSYTGIPELDVRWGEWGRDWSAGWRLVRSGQDLSGLAQYVHEFAHHFRNDLRWEGICEACLQGRGVYRPNALVWVSLVSSRGCVHGVKSCNSSEPEHG